MPLPFFYTANIAESHLTLDEETSRHIVQVLRMKEGESILLTDGAGNSAEGKIIEAHKKRCEIQLLGSEHIARSLRQLTIAISLTKNAGRFEWFLEKATELGTAAIIPLICERTETEKFRKDRLEGICKSAMLQSNQVWLPELHDPTAFDDILNSNHDQRFIAHCAEGDKHALSDSYDSMLVTHLILIGPEGDFTAREIEAATNNGFLPVTLGNTRLRTETAGIFAAVIGATV